MFCSLTHNICSKILVFLLSNSFLKNYNGYLIYFKMCLAIWNQSLRARRTLRTIDYESGSSFISNRNGLQCPQKLEIMRETWCLRHFCKLRNCGGGSFQGKLWVLCKIYIKPLKNPSHPYFGDEELGPQRVYDLADCWYCWELKTCLLLSWMLFPCGAILSQIENMQEHQNNVLSPSDLSNNWLRI